MKRIFFALITFISVIFAFGQDPYETTIDLYRELGTYYDSEANATAGTNGTAGTTTTGTYTIWKYDKLATQPDGFGVMLVAGTDNTLTSVLKGTGYYYDGINKECICIKGATDSGNNFTLIANSGYYIFDYSVKLKKYTYSQKFTFTLNGESISIGNNNVNTDTYEREAISQSLPFNLSAVSASNTDYYNASLVKFQVRVVNEAWLRNKAGEYLTFEMPVGVGYPKTTSTAYIELAEAKTTLQSSLSSDVEVVCAALQNFVSKQEAYLDCTDVMLPETESKVYTISFLKSDGTKYRLRYNESGYTLQEANGDPIGTEFFYAYDMGEGKIAFRNFADKWLVIKNNRDVNEHKGYVGLLDKTYCSFTISKLASSGYVTIDKNQLLGKLALSASSTSTNTDCFIIKESDLNFGNSSAPYYNGTYTSAIVFDEVSESVRQTGMPSMTGTFHEIYGDDACATLDVAATNGDATAYFNAVDDLAAIKFIFSYVDSDDNTLEDMRILAEGGQSNNLEKSVQWKATNVKFIGRDFQKYSSFKFKIDANVYNTWEELKNDYSNPPSENVNVKVVFGEKTGLTVGRYYAFKNKGTNCVAYVNNSNKLANTSGKSETLTQNDINYLFRFENAGDSCYYIYNVGKNVYTKRFGSIGTNTACETTAADSKNNTDNAYWVTNNDVVDGDASVYAIAAKSDINDLLALLKSSADAARYFWHINNSASSGAVIRWSCNTSTASHWYIVEQNVPVVTITSITKDEGDAGSVTLLPTNSDVALAAENKILSWTTALDFGGEYAYHRLTGGTITVDGTPTLYNTPTEFFTALNALTKDAEATLTISNRCNVTHNYLLGGTTYPLKTQFVETLEATGEVYAPTSPDIANYSLISTSWTEGVALMTDVTIDHYYSLTSIPFELSTLEADGSFGSGMKWYTMRQQDGTSAGYWACDNSGNITASNTITTDANKLQTLEGLRKNTWAFVSDGNMGYNIYNYSSGTTKLASAGAYNTNVIVETVGTDGKSQSFVPAHNNTTGAFALFVGGTSTYIDRSGGKPLVWQGSYATTSTGAQMFHVVAVASADLENLASTYRTDYATVQLADLEDAIANVNLPAYFAALDVLDATTPPIDALTTYMNGLTENRDEVGYMTNDALAIAWADAKKAIDTNDKNLAYSAKLAIEAAIAEGNLSIKMPEDGHAYRMGIMNYSDGSLEYLKFDISDGNVTVLNHTSNAAEATVFISRKVERTDHSDGYMFVDSEYKAYLIWKGGAEGSNGNNGFWAYEAANYSSQDCALRLRLGQDPSGSGTGNDKGPVGTFHVYGYRNSSNANFKESAFIFAYQNNVIKSSGEWSNASPTGAYYNSSYSSAMKFEEVDYQANKVTFNPLATIEGVGNVATFSFPARTVMPEGVLAYWAEPMTIGSKPTIHMTAVKGAVGENTGVVVVKEEAGDVRMLPAADEEADNTIEDNKLHGTATNSVDISPETTNVYILTRAQPIGAASSIVGFFRLTSSSDRTIKQYKSYLQVSDEYQTEIDTPQGIRSYINMSWGDMAGGATGVDAVANEQMSDDAYDLSGRRISVLTKGLYIVKGKKVMIK